MEGDTLTILPEEIEVISEAKAGTAVAAEGPYLAALDTIITPELRREGLVRDFIRRVQQLRKAAGLEVADRIVLYYQATPDLHAAIQALQDTVAREVLATQIVAAEPPHDAARAEDAFEGERVTFGLMKAA